MASLAETSPVTVPDLLAAKGRDRIAMLTAYDAPSAALLDASGMDVLLAGDSVEMTVYGRANTLSATMDTMVRHAAAVAGAVRRALVVGDMPFLSYQADVSEAVSNAGRFLAEAGCAAVKVEGGRRILRAVEAILAADIPVMGHVGLTPQSYRKLGGFKGPGGGQRRRRADPPRRRGARRGGMLRGGPGVRSRRPRRADHALHSDSHDRDRRRPGLRRPGPRLPRRDGPEHGRLAALRSPLCRPFLHDPGSRPRLRRRRPIRRLPQQGGVVRRLEAATDTAKPLTPRQH